MGGISWNVYTMGVYKGGISISGDYLDRYIYRGRCIMGGISQDGYHVNYTIGGIAQEELGISWAFSSFKQE